MLLHKKGLPILVVIIAVLFLAACSNSTEKNVIGSWKAVVDGETISYLEIGEERLTNSLGSDSITADYILTESQSDTFLIEVINPENGHNQLLFEGYFENKDHIIAVNTIDGPIENSAFIRIDNIEEEQAKAEAKKEKEREKEEKQRAAEEAEKQKEQEDAAKQAELETEEEVVQEKTETAEVNEDELKSFNETSEYIMELVDKGRLGEAKKRLELLAAPITSQEYSSSLRAMDDMIESAKYDREQERKSPTYNSVKEEYAHKTRMLDEDIEMEHQGDPGIGGYGIHLDDWDGLLNEVWGVLAETMPANEFEQLKQDQLAWIQEKDEQYEKYRDQVDAKDVLTNTTRERTHYLIDNYLN